MNEPVLTQLADVELPFAPTWLNLAPYLGIMVAMVIVLAAALLLWRRRTPRTAHEPLSVLAEFERLRQPEQQAALTPRELAYRLAGLLRVGLNLSQLDDHCPAALAEHQSDWSRIVRALTAARYHADAMLPLSADDFHIMRTWLQLGHAHSRETRHA